MLLTNNDQLCLRADLTCQYTWYSNSTLYLYSSLLKTCNEVMKYTVSEKTDRYD